MPGFLWHRMTSEIKMAAIKPGVIESHFLRQKTWNSNSTIYILGVIHHKTFTTEICLFPSIPEMQACSRQTDFPVSNDARERCYNLAEVETPETEVLKMSFSKRAIRMT